jgi:inositol phosphorylceramide synthase regulatory subunit
MPIKSISDEACYCVPNAECSGFRRGSPVETRHGSFAPFCHLPVAFLHVLLMKLTLKHQLRPRPFTSLLGFLDLKTGVILVVLFAVRAHNPPIIPALLTPFLRCSTRSLVFTASSPFSWAQVETLLNLPSTSTPPSPLSVSHGESARSIKFATQSDSLSHSYSLFTTQENPKHMLYFAHIFFADHILNTIWTVYFIVHWWLYTPHDGRRNAHSPAQQALIDGYIGEHQTMSEAERTAAAERVWRAEKAQALTIIILGWLIKVRLLTQP